MTQRSRLIAAMLLTYFTYGMLLNTVGTVILQSMASLGVTKGQAGWFDGFKDISIAGVSFLTASYLPRLGLVRGAGYMQRYQMPYALTIVDNLVRQRPAHQRERISKRLAYPCIQFYPAGSARHQQHRIVG